MGLWDRMFGGGAAKAQQQPDAQQRFQQLMQKYQGALDRGDQEHIRFENLHVEGDKLYIKGTAPSEDARNSFLNQLEMSRAGVDDVIAEIGVEQEQAQAATAGGAGEQQPQTVTYTVQPGDTLSKISKEYYGNANEYMRIFYANRGTLRDPDHIRVGQELVIPPDNA